MFDWKKKKIYAENEVPHTIQFNFITKYQLTAIDLCFIRDIRLFYVGMQNVKSCVNSIIQIVEMSSIQNQINIHMDAVFLILSVRVAW